MGPFVIIRKKNYFFFSSVEVLVSFLLDFFPAQDLPFPSPPAQQPFLAQMDLIVPSTFANIVSVWRIVDNEDTKLLIERIYKLGH